MKPYHTIPRHVCLSCLLVGMLSACGKKDRAASHTLPPAANAAANNAAAPAATAHPEFARLQGKWRRPDGGYVIDIKTVDAASGKMDAAYFNPQSIHVSKAVAMQEGANTRVFIELQGTNYPGSTYALAYDPAADQLTGIYFQAALRQQFEVYFERLK